MKSVRIVEYEGVRFALEYHIYRDKKGRLRETFKKYYTDEDIKKALVEDRIRSQCRRYKKPDEILCDSRNREWQQITRDVIEGDGTTFKLKNRHPEWHHSQLKGFYGEHYVRLFLNANQVEIEHAPVVPKLPPTKKEFMKESIRHLNYFGLGAFHIQGIELTQDDLREYYRKSDEVSYRHQSKQAKDLVEKYGEVATLPDYNVVGKKIFIEVKTGHSAHLETNQIESFPKILERGYKIVTAHPEIEFDKDIVSMNNIVWREYSPTTPKDWGEIDILDFIKKN